MPGLGSREVVRVVNAAVVILVGFKLNSTKFLNTVYSNNVTLYEFSI